MFSRGMDVVLEYHTAPAIINDSLSKRTMKVVNSRVFICESSRWMMVFQQVRFIYKRFSQVVIKDDGISGKP